MKDGWGWYEGIRKYKVERDDDYCEECRSRKLAETRANIQATKRRIHRLRRSGYKARIDSGRDEEMPPRRIFIGVEMSEGSIASWYSGNEVEHNWNLDKGCKWKV